MVVVLDLTRPKGQLDVALKQLAKRRRKGASILRFVGKVVFEGDPVKTQSQLRQVMSPDQFQ